MTNTSRRESPRSTRQKDVTRAVLVTGASSGIGLSCVDQLIARGCRVFASVRSENDGDRLRGSYGDLVTPIILDLTNDDSVAAAADRVAADLDDAGLDGLVNNAGVAFGGPLEYLPLEYWRKQFDVNVIGQVAVTRAVLPLVRRGGGRVVFIGSISGLLATPLLAPYCASKFAIEAIADSLRNELWPSRLHVCVVEPGAIRTSMWDKARALAEELERVLPPEAFVQYRDAIASMKRDIGKQERAAIPSERVAVAVVHALFARKPRARYIVGTDAKIGAVLARFVPDRLRDRLVRSLVGP